MKTVIDTKTTANAFGTVTVSMWKVGTVWFIGRIEDGRNTIFHNSRNEKYIRKLWKSVWFCLSIANPEKTTKYFWHGICVYSCPKSLMRKDLGKIGGRPAVFLLCYFIPTKSQNRYRWGLTNDDTYARMESMRKSKNMIAMWNVYCYGGVRPVNVSPARWSAMCKFFQNNFPKWPNVSRP